MGCSVLSEMCESTRVIVRHACVYTSFTIHISAACMYKCQASIMLLQQVIKMHSFSNVL